MISLSSFELLFFQRMMISHYNKIKVLPACIKLHLFSASFPEQRLRQDKHKVKTLFHIIYPFLGNLTINNNIFTDRKMRLPPPPPLNLVIKFARHHFHIIFRRLTLCFSCELYSALSLSNHNKVDHYDYNFYGSSERGNVPKSVSKHCCGLFGKSKANKNTQLSTLPPSLHWYSAQVWAFNWWRPLKKAANRSEANDSQSHLNSCISSTGRAKKFNLGNILL